jgi:hypothetical protein
MKVALINDTSLWNNHFGCQLVGQSIREQLSRRQAELIGSFGIDFDAEHPLLKRADLIIVNAEGSIHSGRNEHLLEVARIGPSVLINGVFQNRELNPLYKEFRYVSVRESRSATMLSDLGMECEVVPDLMFGSLMLRSFVRGAAQSAIGLTDNVMDRASGFSPKTPTPADYLRKLAEFRTLCIGRFHAAIAASVLGIPFSTWSSNTHKIEGLMEDMGVFHLHGRTQEEAVRLCPVSVEESVLDYARVAPAKIDKLFDEMLSVSHR